MASHEALLYRDLDEFVTATGAFLQAGLERDEALMVALPSDHLDAVTEHLGGKLARAALVDMTQLGRNPARIIPAIGSWIDEHGGRGARVVGEPLWPGRRDCEAAEAIRHEALVNLAFADAPVSLLCAYDACALGEAMLDDVARTHPVMTCCGRRHSSAHYTDPAEVWAADTGAPAGQPADEMAITADISSLRRFVRQHAAAAQLTEEQTSNLVLAACEGATNALVHGGLPRSARVFEQDGDLICEIVSAPPPMDPLAGRRRPDFETPGGRGLWLINEVCDLVSLRSNDAGTTLRMYMSVQRSDGC